MEILHTDNPIKIFQNWLEEARLSEPNDAEAMALATSDASNQPSVRMVLMKGADEKGFRFFTNMESDKAVDISENNKVGLCFHWKSLLRQVRVEGSVSQLERAEVEAYFHTRHPLSRLGAWASQQSRPLKDRATLEARVDEFREKFKESGDAPCPPHWGGYLVAPQRIEFWQQGAGRLHDRFVFTRHIKGWYFTRLNP